MGFIVSICVFGAVFVLLSGIQQYYTRSVIAEKISTISNDAKAAPPLFLSIGKKVSQWLPALFDPELIEVKVRLAGRPFGLDGESYIGFILVAVVGGLTVGFTLYFAGISGIGMIIILPFVLWCVPFLFISSQASKARNVLLLRLIEFCARLEQTMAGGASTPMIAFNKAAKGTNILAQEMKYVVKACEFKTPLHQAFTDHFVDKLQIPLAEDLGFILRNAGEKGAGMAEPLRELNTEFRIQRQLDMVLKSGKIKSTVTLILTLSVLTASFIWMVLPLIMQTIKDFI